MVNVLKANGEIEPFSEKKLLFSIEKAKIPLSEKAKIIDHIKSKLYENIPTKEIYKHLSEFINKKIHPFYKTKYSLKQSIMDLGPTGHPFENFIGEIFLKALNYVSIELRQILQGKCITHEIDILAFKNTSLPNKVMIETKFHNELGNKTNVHVALYTKARFNDIKDLNNLTEVFLITNTKITLDALNYALCSDMRILSWNYPENNGLRDLIEKHKLYPITILFNLNPAQKDFLIKNNIFTCFELYKNNDLLNQLNLNKQNKQQVLAELKFLLEGKF